ncbi:DUF4870 domain-containing protein [Haloferula sp.]|uniref:DUF4870 domain-containing protein n=1 Tax=Haloferula sp. TaxID=2497595 RepID=UPI0032A02D77
MNDAENQGSGANPGPPNDGYHRGGSDDLSTPPQVTGLAKEERNWALAAHLSSLSSFIGIPGFVGPLVIWLVKKDEMPFASAQAKEALNFQISLFIYAVICFALILTVIGAVIGFPGIIALGLIEIIFTIIASIQAGEGKSYRYPMTFRLID